MKKIKIFPLIDDRWGLYIFFSDDLDPIYREFDTLEHAFEYLLSIIPFL